MTTIFWLAILASIVGFGVFFLSCFQVFNTYKHGGNIVRFHMDIQGGTLNFLGWKYLLLGVVGVIVAVTI